MRTLLVAACLIAPSLAMAQPPVDFDVAAATRFANLALDCVHKEAASTTRRPSPSL